MTCYGGYIARFDAKTLTLEDSVKVGANPEQIIESKGKLYCVNSGYGEGNTLSAIDIQQFKTSTTTYSSFITQQVLLLLVTMLISQRYITLQTGQLIMDKFILTT